MVRWTNYFVIPDERAQPNWSFTQKRVYSLYIVVNKTIKWHTITLRKGRRIWVDSLVSRLSKSAGAVSLDVFSNNKKHKTNGHKPEVNDGEGTPSS